MLVSARISHVHDPFGDAVLELSFLFYLGEKTYIYIYCKCISSLDFNSIKINLSVFLIFKNLFLGQVIIKKIPITNTRERWSYP